MLRTYGKQLASAKRLARYRRALRLSQSQDVVEISRQARRRELVERIAREIVENLIVNGERTAVITDIMTSLEAETGMRLVFEYPLDGGDVRILRETAEGPEEISGDFRAKTLQALWDITLAKVDDTML